MTPLEDDRVLLQSRRTTTEFEMDCTLASLALAPHDNYSRRRMTRLCAEWCSVNQDLHEIENKIHQLASRELLKSA